MYVYVIDISGSPPLPPSALERNRSSPSSLTHRSQRSLNHHILYSFQYFIYILGIGALTWILVMDMCAWMLELLALSSKGGPVNPSPTFASHSPKKDSQIQVKAKQLEMKGYPTCCTCQDSPSFFSHPLAQHNRRHLVAAIVLRVWLRMKCLTMDVLICFTFTKMWTLGKRLLHFETIPYVLTILNSPHVSCPPYPHGPTRDSWTFFYPHSLLQLEDFSASFTRRNANAHIASHSRKLEIAEKDHLK